MSSEITKIEKKDFVTLYTDASARDGITAWAFWARHDNGRVAIAGVCPEDIVDIHMAELYAICQGMYKVINSISTVNGFYIRTDSMYAINVLKGNPSKKPRPETVVRLKTAYDKMVGDHSLDINIKHVKAHTGRIKQVKYWLNNWCDKNAKKILKDRANELSAQTPGV